MHNCPACQTGELIAQSEVRTFNPPALGKPLEVRFASSVCNNCHAKVTTHEQRACNLLALAERKAFYGEWLMGEEVLKLRKRYGITQQQASEIFGKGKIAFSRYETEASYPDLSLAKLMKLALVDVSVMKRLANQAGVELPLLEKRLIEAFSRTLVSSENPGKKVDTVSGTTVQASVAVDRTNAFFAKLLGFMRHPLATDGVQSKDGIVCAANDERFALAA
jgi:putative zinc finger/helix-turn-helix YgiT family protein